MIINEDFKFRDDLIKDEKDTVPIELLTGVYKGVILKYTKVSIKEQKEDTAKLNFDYEIQSLGPGFIETKLRKDKLFNEHIGLILNSLILEVVDNEHREDNSSQSIKE